MRSSTPRVALAASLATLLCVAITIAFFGRAYPLVDAGLRMDRAGALAAARALAAAERLAPASAHAAVTFDRDGELATYVDLAAGGPDSVRALARPGAPVALYRWAVRLYTPGLADEVTLYFTPDGRPAGVVRRLPEDVRRPLVSERAGRLTADAALPRLAAGVGGTAAWRFVSTSYQTQPRSGRVDRTYRYERPDRRVGAAPVRADVTVTGDAAPGTAAPGIATAATVLGVRVYAEVPEAWDRRYQEMRSANDLLAGLSTPPLLLFAVGALAALVHYGRRGRVRWRPAAAVGATVGVLMVAAGLNALPLAWFTYDTATSPATFVASGVLGTVVGGVAAGLWVTLMIAAAEVLTRRAFPRHYDWYATARHAGTPPVAARVLGGYALAAFGFAYVTMFYLGTRSALGWWVPTESLDDPNQIATPLPWVSALGTSLFAGTWEESLFRAVPLALLSLWVGDRPRRTWWMAAGVGVTALAFGFGHANYPSWPAYSRGVELFAEAVVWAVLYLRVGLPTTILAHTLYDLTWFGLFALHGRGPAYRASAAAVLAALALPALVVVIGWWRTRAAGAGAAVLVPRLGDWRPADDPERDVVVRDAAVGDVPPTFGGAVPEDVPLGASPVTAAPAREFAGGAPNGGRPDGAVPAEAAVGAVAVSPRLRLAALAVVAVGVLAALVAPTPERAGPGFTAAPAVVARTADSALRARGVDPTGWDRTLATERATPAPTRRFLRDTLGRAGAVAVLRRLTGSYLVPAAWEARYVRRRGTLAERREEWQVVVLPDGRARRVEHVVAEDAPGAAPPPDSVRALAAAAVRAGVAGVGLPDTRLAEAELTQRPRPRRLDSHVEYVDSAVALPGGATARAVVDLAGAEAVRGGRLVRLPEAWERRDADRQSRRALFGGVTGLLVVAGLITLFVRGGRRPPAPGFGPVVTRRVGLLVGSAAALVSLAGTANELPLAFAHWDTATPWTSHLAALALSAVLGAAVAGLAAGGLWTAADALRRRAGVPFWPHVPNGPAPARAARDAVLFGAALGIAPAALGALAPLARVTAWPEPPTTALDRVLPWATPALGTVDALFAAAALALPVVAFAAGLRTARARLLALGGAALLIGLAASGDGVGPAAAAAAALGVAAFAALTTWAFGRASALPWIAAPLAARAVTGVTAARAAANVTDAAGALLGGAIALALLALVYRLALRAAAKSSGDAGDPAAERTQGQRSFVRRGGAG